MIIMTRGQQEYTYKDECKYVNVNSKILILLYYNTIIL